MKFHSLLGNEVSITPTNFHFGEFTGLGEIEGRLFDIHGVQEINASEKQYQVTVFIFTCRLCKFAVNGAMTCTFSMNTLNMKINCILYTL